MARLKIRQSGLKTTTTIQKEPTGFVDPENLIESYNSSTRKVTLTGTVEGYYRGKLVPELVSSWESPAHADTPADYYLVYNGTSITWVTAGNQKFSDLLIAFVYYHFDKFGLRECHGFMPNETHKELHFTMGTYRKSGGDLGGYVLNSTTLADRRPSVSATLLYDEDLPTTNPLLDDSGSPLYTQQYLSSTSTNNFVSLSDIVPVSGSQPYWNEFTGGSWQQTLMSPNYHMSIWLIAVPTTADSLSQEYRYWWVQGQSESLTLAAQDSLSPNDINLGGIGPVLPEFVFIKQVIIQYTGGNWKWIKVNNIDGTRFSQSTSVHSGLTTVTTDTSLRGVGTVGDPLEVKVTRTTTDPTVNDDNTLGFISGDKWINSATHNISMLADDSTGAADWLELAHKGQIVDAKTDVFTPTLGQTVFTLSQTPVSNDGLLVSLNGQQRLLTTDYTRTGTTLTWQDPVVAGKTVSLKPTDKLVAFYNYGASSGDAIFEEAAGIITAKNAGSTLDMETGAIGFTSGATITEFATSDGSGEKSATKVPTQLAAKTFSQDKSLTATIEAFISSPTVNQNITGTGSWSTIIFDGAAREVGSNFNFTTGVFTLPKSGFFPLSCFLDIGGISDVNMTDLQLAWEYTTGSLTRRVFWRLNPQPSLVSNGLVLDGGYLLSGDAGDTISIGINVNGGITPTVSINGGRFGIDFRGKYLTV